MIYSRWERLRLAEKLIEFWNLLKAETPGKMTIEQLESFELENKAVNDCCELALRLLILGQQLFSGPMWSSEVPVTPPMIDYKPKIGEELQTRSLQPNCVGIENLPCRYAKTIDMLYLVYSCITDEPETCFCSVLNNHANNGTDRYEIIHVSSRLRHLNHRCRTNVIICGSSNSKCGIPSVYSTQQLTFFWRIQSYGEDPPQNLKRHTDKAKRVDKVFLGWRKRKEVSVQTRNQQFWDHKTSRRKERTVLEEYGLLGSKPGTILMEDQYQGMHNDWLKQGVIFQQRPHCENTNRSRAEHWFIID